MSGSVMKMRKGMRPPCKPMMAMRGAKKKGGKKRKGGRMGY